MATRQRPAGAKEPAAPHGLHFRPVSRKGVTGIARYDERQRKEVIDPLPK